MSEGGPRRVAIIHDWLVTYGGAERVLEHMLEVFPQADLYSMVCAMPGEPRRTFRGRPVTTSFIQKLPLGVRKYRAWLPLMPLAVEQFDLSGYDLVLSSSHCVAKGVLTGPDQCHVCYCYSPVRYAWDLQHQYLRQAGLDGVRGWPARYLLHRLRIWDVRTANGVDDFVTLSRFISRRIAKCYGRESSVVYPPVDLAAFQPVDPALRDGHFIAASRMVPYKCMPLIVEAFAGMPDLKLTMIGDGPDFAKARQIARGHANIEILGYQPQSVLRRHLQTARAFVFAAEEDFGIAPLEAQACGTPVIAYGRGGATETILDGRTGCFFHEQSPAAIQAAVRAFASGKAMPAEACRRNAERFSPEAFRSGLKEQVDAAWSRHVASRSERADAT